MTNFYLQKSGIFFPKKLYEKIVTNNITRSPKSSLGYSGVTHKITNDSIKNPDIPVKAGWQGLHQHIEIFSHFSCHEPHDAFLKAEIPHQRALPFIKSNTIHGTHILFDCWLHTQTPPCDRESQNHSLQQGGGRVTRRENWKFSSRSWQASTAPLPLLLHSAFNLSLWGTLSSQD